MPFDPFRIGKGGVAPRAGPLLLLSMLINLFWCGPGLHASPVNQGVAASPLTLSFRASADFDLMDGVISSNEFHAVLPLWEAGEYHIDHDRPLGYAPGPGHQEGIPFDGADRPDAWSLGLEDIIHQATLWQAGSYRFTTNPARPFVSGDLVATSTPPPASYMEGSNAYMPGSSFPVRINASWTNDSKPVVLAYELYVPEGWTVQSWNPPQTSYASSNTLLVPELLSYGNSLVVTALVQSTTSATNDNHVQYLQGDLLWQSAGMTSPERLAMQPIALWIYKEITAQGVPMAWLASYGLTNDPPDIAAAGDQDGDGMLTWQEYIAGTSPVDEQSIFRLEAERIIAAGGARLTWPSKSNRIYWIEVKNKWPAAPWSVIASNIPAQPPLNSFDLILTNYPVAVRIYVVEP